MPKWTQYLIYVEIARARREIPLEYEDWIKTNQQDSYEVEREAR